LRIEFEPKGMTPSEQRAAALASVVGLAIAAVWLIRRERAVNFLDQWPEAVGLVAGIAAWLLLRASWLGWLVAVTCFILLLRRLYVAKILPRHDSTKQSSSIPEELAKP
jgi:hypothetical protein